MDLSFKKIVHTKFFSSETRQCIVKVNFHKYVSHDVKFICVIGVSCVPLTSSEEVGPRYRTSQQSMLFPLKYCAVSDVSVSECK